MEAFNNLKCQLFHSTGALVGTIELSLSEETQLDVGDLPEGAYYLLLAGVEKAFVIVR